MLLCLEDFLYIYTQKIDYQKHTTTKWVVYFVWSSLIYIGVSGSEL